jgi:hypothetical protein
MNDKCEVHQYHSPEPKVPHRHHILPQSWGGETTTQNIVVVCPTGHYNIHHLLDEYVRAHGDPGYAVRAHYGSEERRLALAAWDNRPDGPLPLTLSEMAA